MAGNELTLVAQLLTQLPKFEASTTSVCRYISYVCDIDHNRCIVDGQIGG